MKLVIVASTLLFLTFGVYASETEVAYDPTDCGGLDLFTREVSEITKKCRMTDNFQSCLENSGFECNREPSQPIESLICTIARDDNRKFVVEFSQLAGHFDYREIVNLDVDVEFAEISTLGLSCDSKNDTKKCLEDSGFRCELKSLGSLRSIKCTKATNSSRRFIVQGPQPDGPLHVREDRSE